MKSTSPLDLQFLIVTWLLALTVFSNMPTSAENADVHSDRHNAVAAIDGRSGPFRDCDGCPEMVVIPGGSFSMGSPDDEPGRHRNEGPQRKIAVMPFALARYETTRGEFALFVKATGHTTGPCVYWDTSIPPIRLGYDLDLTNPSLRQKQTDQHPIACVSFDDAQAYVGWLRQKTGNAYRLPSEAEWEYAARAGTRSRFYWGDDTRLACDYANGHDEASRQTNPFNWASLPCHDGFSLAAPVGSFASNGYSLFDMAGNLWEWVDDHYRMTYDGLPIDGRSQRSFGQSARVLRGGSWESEPRDLRSASRIWSRAGSRLNSNGFRVALTLSEPPDPQ